MASKTKLSISKSPAIRNKQKYVSNQEMLVLQIESYIKIYKNLENLGLMKGDHVLAIINRLEHLKELANKC